MSIQTYKKIPNLLRKYRRIRGLNQKEIAAILGLRSASLVSRWEKGRCIPSLMNAIRLAILCRSMVDALFFDHVRALRVEIRDREERVLGTKNSNQ
ncbi:MAG TPA: helix-turn-helix transcriptional regulator [Bacteroidota bacterium]|nr:helix-turn-helix transcriptional regulator [Bacteroidota bacterium]